MRHPFIDLRALGSHVAEGTIAILAEHHDVAIPPPVLASERRIYHRSDEAVAKRRAVKTDTSSRGRRTSAGASA